MPAADRGMSRHRPVWCVPGHHLQRAIRYIAEGHRKPQRRPSGAEC
jgi:hypothetical protein